jgi:hypothetical protein
MNKRKLTVDKTYLSIDGAETRGFIHRDYIAHCLRWTHFLKSIAERHLYKGAKILDIGCGRELPLAKTLYSSRLIPHEYVGVDVGPIDDDAADAISGGKFQQRLYEHTDLLEPEFLDDELGTFNFITCFEVLEHVEPDHMLRMLSRMVKLLAPLGQAFISTPCWNVTDCAANHVDEMRFETLRSCLWYAGFKLLRVHGTFASIRDYQSHLHEFEGLERIFNKLRDYYDTNFLSCVFAPLFPAESRNALWVVRPRMSTDVVEPQQLELTATRPYGSSDKWAKMEASGELAALLTKLIHEWPK